MSTIQDLTGQKFGKLTAVSFVERSKRKTFWRWLCDCGNEKIAWASHVKEGRVKSCGCANSESRRAKPDWHGKTNSPEYRTWTNMMTRCYNEKTERFAHYGGKGVRVCERWHDFKLFYADMGDRPVGTSIDRINSDGDYELENCRWATKKEQADNRSISVWIEFDGKRLVLTDWARFFNVTQEAIRKRMRNHGTLEGYKPYKCAAKGRTE